MPNWPLFQLHPLLCLLVYLLFVGAGLPLPITPALIVAGSLAAGGTFAMPLILLAAPLALLPGDLLWYALARRHGHRVVNAV